MVIGSRFCSLSWAQLRGSSAGFACGHSRGCTQWLAGGWGSGETWDGRASLFSAVVSGPLPFQVEIFPGEQLDFLHVGVV